MMIKKMMSVIMIASICILAGTAAFAGTPEFGRTQDEWSRIRDNTLEYDEIDALIKEYNPTVISNAVDLREFKRTYGTTNDEVSQKYRELAEQLNEDVDLDPDDPMYAMNAMAAASNHSTARQLEQQADNTLEDYEIKRMEYEMQEKQLVQKAKSDMIAYYSNQLEAQRAKLNVELLQTQLEIKKAQADSGEATQIDVLKATEELLNAQKSHTTAQAAVETSKKKLQVACGWKYDETPVIAALPAPDMAVIAAMSPEADRQKALDNNYTLKINKRKLSNAHSEANKDTLNTTIAGNMQNIPLSVNTAYLMAVAAKEAYEYSVTANEVQKKSYEQMKIKHDTGNASDFDLKAQKITSQISEIAVQQAKNAALEAIMNYESAVNGLAGA